MISKTIFTFVLITLVAFATIGYGYEIVIRPAEAVLMPGTGIHFDAQAFADNGTPVLFHEYNWSIEPPELGMITDDGFFMAGREPGRGLVIASTTIAGVRVFGKAKVLVGTVRSPEIELVIRPGKATVQPGDSLKFNAVAVTNSGRHVIVDALRWILEPQELGTIDSEGRFVAGDKICQGQVIAIAEIGREKFRAEADLAVVPPPNSGIAGTVTDLAGNILADALVTAHRLGEVRWHGETKTDANGDYVLDNLIPGKYVVRAVTRNYLPEFYHNVRYMKEASPVEVAENDTTNDIDFSLELGAFISGTIKADEDASLLAGVHVVAVRVTDKFQRHALTDENGNYLVGALDNGSYILFANKDGYRSEYYDNKFSMEDADLINVTAPDTIKDRDFSLGTHSAIMGMVTDEATGTGLEGAVVSAWRAPTLRAVGAPFARTRTEKDGSYTLQLPPGAYYVHTEARGYAGEFYNNVVRIADATPVKVLADQHTLNIDFALVKLGAISGKVTEQDSDMPIVGAMVQAFREGPGWDPREVATDSFGNYIMENVPAGNYVVMARARGFLHEYYQEVAHPGDATIVTVTNNATTRDINFTLTKGGSIAGTVFSWEDNTPLAGALVKIVKVDGRHLVKTVVTNRMGQYEVAGLPTGKYIVHAVAKGHRALYYDNVKNLRDATKIDVTAPEKVENIDFKLPKRILKNSTITGRVVDETDNSPIFGAMVLATRVGHRGVFWTFTGPEGYYELDDLKPGHYIVYVAASGYLNEFYDNVYRWWRATPVLVKMNEIITGIDFALTPHEDGLYLLSGIVADANGEPVDGALLFAETDEGIVSSAVSDEHGSYVFDGLTAGSYRVWASMPDFEETFVGGSSDIITATEITVGMGNDYTSANIILAMATGVEIDAITSIPDKFALHQNYPNPFNPSTSIGFDLPEAAKVKIEVFNMLGQKVITLVNENRPAGQYHVTWNGKDENGLPPSSGIYFYRIEAKMTGGRTFSQTQRMMLLK